MKRRSEVRKPEKSPPTFEERVLARVRRRKKIRRQRALLLASIILILTSFYLLIHRWEEQAYRSKTFQFQAGADAGRREIHLTDRYYFPTRKDNAHYLLSTVALEESGNQF